MVKAPVAESQVAYRPLMHAAWPLVQERLSSDKLA
jgi:hypothetical protein